MNKKRIKVVGAAVGTVAVLVVIVMVISLVVHPEWLRDPFWVAGLVAAALVGVAGFLAAVESAYNLLFGKEEAGAASAPPPVSPAGNNNVDFDETIIDRDLKTDIVKPSDDSSIKFKNTRVGRDADIKIHIGDSENKPRGGSDGV